MAITYEATVTCDVCGQIGAVVNTRRPADARSEVQRVGWTREGGSDVCPDHSEDDAAAAMVLVA